MTTEPPRPETDVRDAIVRPFRPADRAAILRICVQTADAGRDASHLHADPRELTDRWATPYLDREPGLAFVAERDGEVVGYVLGTADTAAFSRATRLPVAECEGHPAHLHIDLSEGARGGGLGRRLVQAFAAALPPGTGVHVVVDPANPGALAFYPRVGFEPLGRNADGVVFGLRPRA